MDRIEQILASTPIFKKLSPEDRVRLVPHARVRDYAKGERIFAEGSPSDRFYAIASGRVKVFKMTPAGKAPVAQDFSPVLQGQPGAASGR